MRIPWAAAVALVAACRGSRDVEVDAAPVVDVDAPPTAVALLPGPGCGSGIDFRVGPPDLARLTATLDDASRIVATFVVPGQPGAWLSITELDGDVVLPPTPLAGRVVRPTAIAVNGDRVLIAGNNIAQAYGLDGTPLPPHALVCPSAFGCATWRLARGPGDGFRVFWSPSSSAEAQVLDHDGQPAGALVEGAPLEAPFAPAGDTLYYGGTARQQVGACTACSRATFGSLDGALVRTSLGSPIEPNGIGSGAPSVTWDGASLYASWRYYNPLDATTTGVHLARLPDAPTVDLPQASVSLMVATAPGSGALVYRLGTTTYLTRFRDGPLTVSAATQQLPAPLDASGLPAYVFPADADHALTLDGTGLARCWSLPP